MAVIGEQLQVTPPYFGEWEPIPTGFSFQWEISDNGTTGWADITGETRSDYILLTTDVGNYFRCCVVAINPGGSSSEACSAAVGPVTLGAAIPVAPDSLVLTPVVVGSLSLTPATSSSLTLTPATSTELVLTPISS